MPQIVEIGSAPVRADAPEEAISGLMALGPEIKASKGLVAMYHGRVTERPNALEFASSKQPRQVSGLTIAHDELTGFSSLGV